VITYFSVSSFLDNCSVPSVFSSLFRQCRAPSPPLPLPDRPRSQYLQFQGSNLLCGCNSTAPQRKVARFLRRCSFHFFSFRWLSSIFGYDRPPFSTFLVFLVFILSCNALPWPSFPFRFFPIQMGPPSFLKFFIGLIFPLFPQSPWLSFVPLSGFGSSFDERLDLPARRFS